MTTATPSRGMNWQLSDEQRMLRDTARAIAEAHFAPKAAHFDATSEFPWENVAMMRDNEFFGIPFPTEYGGVGMDTLSYAIVVEEVSRACGSTGVILSAHVSLGCYPIYLYGTEAQKQKFLTPLAKGEKLGAFCLTEPSAGSDAAHLATRAVKEGDDWVLNGQKIFITNGGVADTYIVFATTDPNLGHKGQVAFIVEKGTPGLSFGKTEDKLGIRASMTREVLFENCRVPDANRLGEVGKGFSVALGTLDGGRIGIAAQALGIAQASLDLASQYAKERVQFGSPLADKQAIQFMLADMATEIEAARLLTWQAASLKDQGLNHSKESAMAKLFASETAMRASLKAVQILGGYGYIKEFPAERLMRDAKITEIYEGTSEVQRMIIARKVLQG